MPLVTRGFHYERVGPSDLVMLAIDAGPPLVSTSGRC